MPIVDPKVEIEFVAGVWTDVTGDVDLSAGITIKYGRTSEFSTAQTATCDFQLANHLGKYTPRAQLLADGVTTHPYWPNIVPRKRVRVSNASGNRFLGYVKSWVPSLENGVRAYVVVSANDRQDQLSRINFRTMYEQELTLTPPTCSYLLSDVQAATGIRAVFLDTSGNSFPPLVASASGNVTFVSGAGPAMPAPDGLTGLSVTSTSSNLTLTGRVALASAAFAFGGWVTVPKVAAGNAVAGQNAVVFDCKNAPTTSSDPNPPTGDVQLAINYGTGVATLAVSMGAFAGSPLALLGSVINATAPDDGLPHHYMLIAATPSSQQVTLYIDGVSKGTSVFTAGQIATPTYVSTLLTNGSGLPITLGPQAAWASAPASTVPSALWSAGCGRPGDTTGQRVTRFMQYVGLAPGEYSIDAGSETLSSAQGISGKSVLTACQEIAVTEGAGSAFYFDTSGLARFCDRTYRKPAAPNLTLSAELDLDGVFAPSLDDLTLVNRSTVTRGAGNALTYTDAASLSTYGISTDSATSYAATDGAALNLAQQRVSSQSAPGLRVPQFTVDLLTSSVAASAFAGMQIGWRARINTLPVGINAASRVDVIIEGWSETITKTSWAITFDASPADVPPRFVWGDVTYGRWGPGTSMTLAAAITAAATSVSVATTAGNPTFTLAAGAYPLPIKIGEEEMTITAAPASSASPQTLTVTRGTSGTKAAPQSAGAQVSLSPATAWTL